MNETHTHRPGSGQVIWTEKARQNLREIVRYLRQHSPEAAERISKEITASTRRLETFPISGRIVPELAETSFREVIVGDYRVIYEVTEDDTVEILTIVHSRRLLPHPRQPRE
ncbi:MAG: type II toxin-antitoxin system RelE/ParE family toxin, partial [Anaerolineae bacterium]